jgi:anti-anti-sigma factor
VPVLEGSISVSATAPGGALTATQPLDAAIGRAAREPRSLRVRAVDVGCRALLRIAGPLDAVTSPALGESLEPFRRRGQWLIVDLRRVEYIETPGLRLLMTVNEELQAEGGQLCLVVRPGSRVERTVRLVGLDQRCPVVPTVRDAWHGPVAPAAAADRPARGGGMAE